MDISAMLKPSNIRCQISAGSKKHALEQLSEVLADAVAGPTAGEVLEGLANRERLGSTGLGRSVAVPHTRVAGRHSSAAAFLKLVEPIEFGSPDGQPVDLLFGLLIPDESTTNDLTKIDVLIETLCDPKLQAQLRNSNDPDRLCALLIDSLASADTAH